MESYKKSVLEFNLFDLGFEVMNLAVFFCLAVTASLVIYSAIKRSPQFWYFFSALAIVTILALMAYWLRSSLFQANIQATRLMPGSVGAISGDAYFAHLNFIQQSMIGVFMMIASLTVRRFGKRRK